MSSREGNLICTRFFSERYSVLSFPTFISFPCDAKNGKSISLLFIHSAWQAQWFLPLPVMYCSQSSNYSICYYTSNKIQDLHYCWWLVLFHVFSVLSFPYQCVTNILFYNFSLPCISPSDSCWSPPWKALRHLKQGIPHSEQQFVWKHSPQLMNRGLRNNQIICNFIAVEKSIWISHSC